MKLLIACRAKGLEVWLYFCLAIFLQILPEAHKFLWALIISVTLLLLIISGITKQVLYPGQEELYEWGSLSTHGLCRCCCACICLPEQATEVWTSPAVLILETNSRMFVSHIKRKTYLKLRNVKVLYIKYCMKFPYAFWVFSIHFRAVILIAGINYQ